MKEEQNTRRSFLSRAALLGAAAVLTPRDAVVGHAVRPSVFSNFPLAVSSANGLGATAKAVELLRSGADTLDAAVAGVGLVEDDPNDNTVGYGGLPNEDGVVELDSCVMHGPSGRGAGVAALRNIRHPSQVARMVMTRTDHVLLVGEGALRFARAHGFKEEDLLTEASREEWLRWKETLSTSDDWLPPHDMDTREIGMRALPRKRPTGTITCLVRSAGGDISGCTTTSGLAFKIPGRVGDSPILGAGLYVDNEVGAAGSTGRGEANLLSLASAIIVERMRAGDHPTDACLYACKRVAAQTKMRRLLDECGRPAFNVRYYALNKRGEHGSASIWSGGSYAVHTGEGESRLLDSAALFER